MRQPPPNACGLERVPLVARWTRSPPDLLHRPQMGCAEQTAPPDLAVAGCGLTVGAYSDVKPPQTNTVRSDTRV